MKIIGGSRSKELAKQLSRLLEFDYIESLVTRFADTELKVEVSDSLYNENVIIVQSLSRPVNDSLVELLLLMDIVKRAFVKKIILVIPYFGYSRQDRLFSEYSSIPAEVVARLLQDAGANHIITVDLHSTGIEEFFKIPVQNLKAMEAFIPIVKNYSNFIIVFPDSGSVNRLSELQEIANIERIIAKKHRDSENHCTILGIDGEVAKKNCIIIDDIIDGGQTLLKTADFLLSKDALSVDALITHAVLSNPARDNIQNSIINNIYITDTIEQDSLPSKFHITSIAPILAKSLKKHKIYELYA